MSASRRKFLARSAAVLAAGSVLRPALADPGPPDIRIGTCMLGIADAARAGLDGVEVNVGPPADTLRIADPAVRDEYRRQIEATGIPICSLMMGLFNDCPLATDPRAEAWMRQAITGAADLGARVILLAFLGNGDLLDAQGQLRESDVDAAAKRIRAVAPAAADAGVVLAIENYLDAAQNIALLDRVDHPAVQLYYDCFNTGATRGHDVPAEIRRLGSRIVQFHFKAGSDYLETGPVAHAPVVAAIREIGYKGWIVLENSAPSGDAVADARRNATYARSLLNPAS